VERDAAACAALERNRTLLNAETMEIVQAEVGRFLAGTGQPFDLVFLDPPFRRNLIIPCCRALEEHGWLSPRAKIYLEAESGFRLDGLPENWRVLRGDTAGEVGYHLCERMSPGSSS
jgi:16S rRNA (guanine966-N2)-methyltransferase